MQSPISRARSCSPASQGTKKDKYRLLGRGDAHLLVLEHEGVKSESDNAHAEHF